MDKDVGLIVSAYVSQTKGVDLDELCTVIKSVRHALTDDLTVPEVPTAPVVEPKSKKEVKDSILEKHLISFEDGLGYRNLKRHLSARGLTPEQYRAKHGLPDDYPMVHPSYSAERSELAKKMQLGRKKVVV